MGCMDSGKGQKSTPPPMHRTRVYELFASLFLKEPTLSVLRLLEQKKYTKFFNSFGISLLSDLEDYSFREKIERLQAEYARLFVVPNRPVPLHESLNRKEGRFWGESTSRVAKIYRKFGFELDSDFKEMPDHISAELMFLAKLTDLEREYGDENLSDAKQGVLEVKKHFLKNRLLAWFPGLKGAVLKHAEFSFYKGLVQILYSFLDDELRRLKDIKDI